MWLIFIIKFLPSRKIINPDKKKIISYVKRMPFHLKVTELFIYSSHVNKKTSFDENCYTLSLPTDFTATNRFSQWFFHLGFMPRGCKVWISGNFILLELLKVKKEQKQKKCRRRTFSTAFLWSLPDIKY